jgi:hypothetical protein
MAHLKHKQIDQIYNTITPDQEEASCRLAEKRRRSCRIVDIVTITVIIGGWVALFFYAAHITN